MAGGGRWAPSCRWRGSALWSVGFNAAYGGWITTFAPVLDAGARARAELRRAVLRAFRGRARSCSGPRSPASPTGRDGAGWSPSARGSCSRTSSTLAVGAPVALIYGTAVVAGGGLAAAQSSWFALLGVATDGGRRGRSFGLVSALSNLGVIAGAAVASTAWATIGLREGLISSGVFLVLAAASLALIPSDRRRA